MRLLREVFGFFFHDEKGRRLLREVCTFFFHGDGRCRGGRSRESRSEVWWLRERWRSTRRSDVYLSVLVAMGLSVMVVNRARVVNNE